MYFWCFNYLRAVTPASVKNKGLVSTGRQSAHIMHFWNTHFPSTARGCKLFYMKMCQVKIKFSFSAYLLSTVGSKGKVDTWSWFVSDSSCFSTFIHSHAQADWFSFHSFFEKWDSKANWPIREMIVCGKSIFIQRIRNEPRLFVDLSVE